MTERRASCGCVFDGEVFRICTTGAWLTFSDRDQHVARAVAEIATREQPVVVPPVAVSNEEIKRHVVGWMEADEERYGHYRMYSCIDAAVEAVRWRERLGVSS